MTKSAIEPQAMPSESTVTVLLQNGPDGSRIVGAFSGPEKAMKAAQELAVSLGVPVSSFGASLVVIDAVAEDTDFIVAYMGVGEEEDESTN